jgi:hypothetical protein
MGKNVVVIGTQLAGDEGQGQDRRLADRARRASFRSRAGTTRDTRWSSAAEDGASADPVGLLRPGVRVYIGNASSSRLPRC